MANLNKVMLIGNLTRDPELKYLPKGTAVVDLGMAINRKYTVEATGEKRDETTFVDVTLFGRQAEIAKEFLTKGKPVYIEGRLTLDTWDDKTTGQKRSKLKVTGDALQLLGSRGDVGDDSGGSGGGRSYPSGGGGGGNPSGGGGGDEYDQHSSRPAARPAGGGGGGQGAKPKPAPAASYNDEDDDIPF